MTVDLDKNSTLPINEAVLKGVMPGMAQVVDAPITIPLGDALLRRYKDFERTLLLPYNQEEELTAVSAGVLVNKLKQFAAGTGPCRHAGG